MLALFQALAWGFLDIDCLFYYSEDAYDLIHERSANLTIVMIFWCNGGRKNTLTVQNDSGRKKILTNVRSLTFSPSLVEALLSMTALALNSYGVTSDIVV